MINKKQYREFHTEEEFNEWTSKNFGQWFQNMKANKNSNKIYEILSLYTSSMNVPYNKLLRGIIEPDLDKEVINTYLKNIEIIKKEISKFSLQENIITYRYLNKIGFNSMFASLKPQKGTLCADKGFMSTTLLPHYMKDFPKNHKCDCLLKLYLPKGAKGAYIGYNNQFLKEYEYLLPPKCTFKYFRSRYSLNYNMWIYECELVKQ